MRAHYPQHHTARCSSGTLTEGRPMRTTLPPHSGSWRSQCKMSGASLSSAAATVAAAVLSAAPPRRQQHQRCAPQLCAAASGPSASSTAPPPPPPPPHDARADAIAERSRGLRAFGFPTDFADRFELGAMLGSGSFATVHACVERATGRRYAVKTLPKRFAGDGATLDPAFAARVLREVDVYRTLGRSLNVAHLEGAYEDGVAVDLVLELCAGGTMWARIKRGAYDERGAARLVREVLRAVAQAHAAGIAVRDVKPDNFLFLHDGADAPLKMVDFGLAQFCRDGEVLADRVGTPFYCAPELLRQRYGRAVDVWSAGVTAYVLLTGRWPWHADPDIADAVAADAAATGGGDGLRSGRGGVQAMSNKTLFRAILSAEFDFSWDPWPDLSPEAADCVRAMLERDPEKRPTAAELLRHPWFEQQLGDSSGSGGDDGAAAGADGGRASGPSSRSASPPLADSLVQRLQLFGTYTRLKQLALREVAARVLASRSGGRGGTGSAAAATKQQQQEQQQQEQEQGQPPARGPLDSLADAFGELDTDGSGRVTLAAAARALKGEGRYDLSDDEIRSLLAAADLDSDGAIDGAEFCAALADWALLERRAEWPSWVSAVFDAIDADGSGRISTAELAAALAAGSSGSSGSGSDGGNSSGSGTAPDVLPAALVRADADGDGFITLDEFADLLRNDADALALFSPRLLKAGGRPTALSPQQRRQQQQQRQQQQSSP